MVRLRVGHQHSQFWPTLPRFMDYYSLFWYLGAISMIDAPRGALTFCSPAIIFRSILGSFMDYYSPFWGPRAISTIDDPRGAFTCPSSTVAIFADSGPFRALLLTVLGSESDFHGC